MKKKEFDYLIDKKFTYKICTKACVCNHRCVCYKEPLRSVQLHTESPSHITVGVLSRVSNMLVIHVVSPLYAITKPGIITGYASVKECLFKKTTNLKMLQKLF